MNATLWKVYKIGISTNLPKIRIFKILKISSEINISIFLFWKWNQKYFENIISKYHRNLGRDVLFTNHENVNGSNNVFILILIFKLHHLSSNACIALHHSGINHFTMKLVHTLTLAALRSKGYWSHTKYYGAWGDGPTKNIVSKN